MKIYNKYSLKLHNTFGVDVSSDYFIKVKSKEEAIISIDKINSLTKKIFVLGGGSNLLLTQNFKGAVIKINIKGIEVLYETKNHVFVKVGAGENWHRFVLWAIKNNSQGKLCALIMKRDFVD